MKMTLWERIMFWGFFSLVGGAIGYCLYEVIYWLLYILPQINK